MNLIRKICLYPKALILIGLIFITHCAGHPIQEQGLQTDIKAQAKLEEERRNILEHELIRYCPLMKDQAPLQMLKSASACPAFLSFMISWDRSFELSEKSQQQKQVLLTLLAKTAMETFEWPEGNHLLSFPFVEFPKSMGCRFAPEKDPKKCQGMIYHPAQSTLGQRLVSYLLAKNFHFAANKKTEEKENSEEKEFTAIAAFSPTSSSLYLYPGFWTEPSLVQIGTLLHELKHSEPPYHHVPCNHILGFTKSPACDESLIDGRFAFNLLLDEIRLRRGIQDQRDLIEMEKRFIATQQTGSADYRQLIFARQFLSNKPDSVPGLYTLAAMLYAQCSDLEMIVHLPPLMESWFPCSFGKSLEFVKSHKSMFGLDAPPVASTPLIPSVATPN